MNKKILVTGAAGFIGFHTAIQFIKNGFEVVGIDNLNDYYEQTLKIARLKILEKEQNFLFEKIDISDQTALEKIFCQHSFHRVIHLAAQAGVRYSIENPNAYVQSNLLGFANILEACRHAKTPHLVYASSSSVYGSNTDMPFKVSQNVDHPVSFYAATKKSNELMAHSYSHLYKLPTTALRFFTVYGPWGRPDMALFLFTKAISKGEKIEVYNHGKMQRDFTYIDDIVDAILKVSEKIPQSSNGKAPYKVFNIGNDQPQSLETLISLIEKFLGKKAKKKFMPLQDGDVLATWADINDLRREINYSPKTSLEKGIEKFIQWYKQEYAS